jgi:hypothetical protein
MILKAASRLAASKGPTNPRDKELLPSGWTIDRWYDSSVRSWVVQLKDSHGNQVGESHYVYNRADAKNITVDSWDQRDIDNHVDYGK